MDDTSDQARKQLYEIFRDADGNGIPDILEGKLRGEDIRNLVTSQTNTFKVIVDGKEYANFNELPSDKQQQIERSLDQLVKLSTQAGNFMKGFGLFKLIKWFTGRGRRTPQGPPSYQQTSSSFLSKALLFLIGALIAVGVAYFIL